MASTRQPLALDRPGVRVQTLVLLRWSAIAGQLLALLIVGVLVWLGLRVWKRGRDSY